MIPLVQTLKPFTNTFSQFGPNDLSLKILSKRLTMNSNSGFFLATSQWVLVLFEWHWHPKIISPKKFDNTINTIQCKYNTKIFSRDTNILHKGPNYQSIWAYSYNLYNQTLRKWYEKTRLRDIMLHLSHYMCLWFNKLNISFKIGGFSFLSTAFWHKEHFSCLYTY